MDYYGHLCVFPTSVFVQGVLVGNRRDCTRLFAAKGLREICLVSQLGQQGGCPVIFIVRRRKSSAGRGPRVGRIQSTNVFLIKLAYGSVVIGKLCCRRICTMCSTVAMRTTGYCPFNLTDSASAGLGMA